ncbi:MAG TPA: permease prefix domain 1-containing protein [Planctomycetota bacterium]|nr:permease prefix domain 1-containing protein [Planctomycetota bacterium]
MSFLRTLGLPLRPSDPRTVREVDDEIHDELEFHLAMRVRDNVAAGMSEDDARRDAERRFGDVDVVRRECRKTQLGDRLMVQRLSLVLMLVVLAAVVALAAQTWSAQRASEDSLMAMRADLARLTDALKPSASPPSGVVRIGDDLVEYASDGTPGTASRRAIPPCDPDCWLAKFRDASWRDAFAAAGEMAKLGCEDGLPILRAVFARIETVQQRQQVVKAWFFAALNRRMTCVLDVLDLGATDRDLAVQGWAFSYVKDLAFRDFSGDYEGYLAWRASVEGLSLVDAVHASARAFVERVRALHGAELVKALREMKRLDFRAAENAGADPAAAMRDAGLVDAVVLALADPGLDGDARATVVGWLASVRPDRETLERVLLPLLDADESTASAVCRALGTAGGEWAIEPLLTCAHRALVAHAGDADGAGNAVAFSVGDALAELRATSAVPMVIALIRADDTYATKYGLGYFALEKLTGVRYDESHDGAWWADWWTKNRARISPEFASLELPAVELGR